ncbi:DUF6600 domain-containing protein [Aquabacterium sp.]|uniref:DUF6600 domain-containing protein n=1 Tax=Aquabacterium sp. TaxID=1872578 RepID=UPI0037845603
MLTLHRRLGALLTGLALLLPLAVRAQNEDLLPADWPGRVGRIVEVQGSASQLDRAENVWIAAVPNRPLTSGDHIVTDPGARLELRIGSATVRLDGRTDLLLARLDDQAIVLQLNTGSLALKVVSQAMLPQIEVVTLEGRFRPQQIGHYRVDQRDDGSDATSWRGELRFEGRDSALDIPAGRHAELWLEGSVTHYTWREVARDAFADWVAYDDTQDPGSVSARYVSPEMTGWEDLDRYGSWQTHPEYGGVWIPTAVPVGWAPYRSGHWAWIWPWGWTWVDDARWGFAPFHYGRWVFWGRRWCWVPEHRSVRPTYSPALVAWVGAGTGFGNGRAPGPAVGWVPLGPREPYHRRAPSQGPGTSFRPMNQAIVGAVTAVPAEAFSLRRVVQPTPATGGGLPAVGQWRAVAVPAAPAGIVQPGQRAPAPPAAPRAPVPMAPERAAPTLPRAPVPTAPERVVPTAPERAVPTAPGRAVPTAPERAVPTAPERVVPTAPERVVPTAPERVVPTAPRAPVPTAPERVVPRAPERAVPTAPERTAPPPAPRVLPAPRPERPEAPARPPEAPRTAPEAGHRAAPTPTSPPPAHVPPAARAEPPAAPTVRAPPPAAAPAPAPATPRARPDAREQDGQRRAAPEQRQEKDKEKDNKR